MNYKYTYTQEHISQCEQLTKQNGYIIIEYPINLLHEFTLKCIKCDNILQIHKYNFAKRKCICAYKPYICPYCNKRSKEQYHKECFKPIQSKITRLSKVESHIAANSATFLFIENYADKIKDWLYGVQCKNNHINTYYYADLIKNKRCCHICTNEIKFTPDNAIKNLEKKFIKLISEYKNVHDQLDVKCTKCSYEFSNSYYNLNNAKNPCPQCAGRVTDNNIMNALCQENNLKLIKYESHTKVNVECINCSHIFNISSKAIKRGTSCPNCGNFEDHENIKETGLIYKITSPFGKIYIGQTIQKFNDRYSSYKYDYNNPTKPAYDMQISYAFRKYGFENFQWEILHVNIPYKELNDIEIQEIKNHKSNQKEYGYNSTKGGQNEHLLIKNVITKHKQRIEKEKKLKEQAEKKRALNFGKNIDIEIKRFLRQKKDPLAEEKRKINETIKRKKSAKLKFQNNTPDSSKYRGVCWDKGNRKWRANIKHEGKKIHLGLFVDEEDAAKAYDEAALKYHGDKATLNFS